MNSAIRISHARLILLLIFFSSYITWGNNINREDEKSSEILQKSASGWPSYLHDSQRSGVTDENLDRNMTEQWRYYLTQKPTPS